MSSLLCPSCKAVISGASIPDEVILTERGRRNAGKRKVFRGRPRGLRMVWLQHKSSGRRCLCGACRLTTLAGIEAALEKQHGVVAAPSVQEKLDHVRALRAAVEEILRQRRASAPADDRAALVKGQPEKAQVRVAA